MHGGRWGGVAGRERGVTLLEALIAVVIFGIGTLALVGMFARSIGTARDSQFRTEAAVYAAELLNAISGAVDRDPSTGEVIPSGTANSLDRFTIKTSGGLCAFSPQTGTLHPLVGAWKTKVRGAAGLPWPDATVPVQVVADPADHNRVTVTICWRPPGEAVANHHVVSGHVN